MFLVLSKLVLDHKNLASITRVMEVFAGAKLRRQPNLARVVILIDEDDCDSAGLELGKHSENSVGICKR